MIEVLRAGVLTTVQDLGRIGSQHYGVPVSGAMDTLSLRAANLLAGNAEGAAALEFTLDGPTLRFEHDALIAICGGEFAALIDGVEVPAARPVWLSANSELQLGACRRGCRGYLAIAGGIDVEPVLESRSTYLRAGFGGLQGRSLRRGDRFGFGRPATVAYPGVRAKLRERGAHSATPHWAANLHPERLTRSPQVIRFVPARHWENLDTEARANFLASEYRIGANSDRMGYRLEGADLETVSGAHAVSEGVVFGTIQLPPDGSPIVLMADRQTTGGYPRLGEVAGVDLPLLAQLKPGDSLRFEKLALAEAQRLWLVQEESVAQLRESIRAHVDQ